MLPNFLHFTQKSYPKSECEDGGFLRIWNNYEKIDLCGKQIPEPIIIEAEENRKIVRISFKSKNAGTGFKISFSTSYDPGMLMDKYEMQYLDGLRVLYQDLGMNGEGLYAYPKPNYFNTIYLLYYVMWNA